MSLSPSEQLLYAATKITTLYNGKILSYGTGFFYVVELGGDLRTILLVTNKHVFEGCNGINLTLPLRNEDGTPSEKTHTWELAFEGKPIDHPDPNVDLSVLSITDIHQLNENGEKRYPFYVTLSKDVIPSEEMWSSLDAIEEVTMIGCPNGLIDNVNNSPIIRRGITATHPKKNYEGRQEFMIDLACFPGSSGSPVFLYNKGMIYNRNTKDYSIGMEVYFLGILYAGPTIDQNGHIIMSTPVNIRVNATMHLGMVIKSTQLNAFEEMVKKQLNVA